MELDSKLNNVPKTRLKGLASYNAFITECKGPASEHDEAIRALDLDPPPGLFRIDDGAITKLADTLYRKTLTGVAEARVQSKQDA
eukprot:4775471-Karenia_brevis.AAC.1